MDELVNNKTSISYANYLDKSETDGYINFPSLVFLLMTTINVLSARIDETVDIIKSNAIKEEFIENYKKRVYNLVDARMCLIYSLLDLGVKIDNKKVDYFDLKHKR